MLKTLLEQEIRRILAELPDGHEINGMTLYARLWPWNDRPEGAKIGAGLGFLCRALAETTMKDCVRRSESSLHVQGHGLEYIWFNPTEEEW